jgi:transposase-like protein
MRCIKTRGKKGVPHTDKDDPPRRRANSIKGHGTWENDRPPVVGIAGRDTHGLRLRVTRRNSRVAIQPVVVGFTRADCTVNTDEWVAYDLLPQTGRKRVSVKHSRPNCEYARDDDGDGIREVHCNTSEGIWTGLRNFLRPFRGVSKKYLDQYVAIFEWSHNIKTVTQAFLSAMLSGVASTSLGT